jgi:hypothetical protein
VIGGEGGLHVSIASEDHDADTMAAGTPDEISCDLAQGIDPGGLEIVGQHAQRDIQSEHHIDAFVLDEVQVLDPPGVGHTKQQQGDEQTLGGQLEEVKGKVSAAAGAELERGEGQHGVPVLTPA